MKNIFVVAGNAFTVSVDGRIAAWEAIERRYRPFAAAEAGEPVLEVEIRQEELPASDAESIYEPVPSEVSFVSSRALRQADGAYLFEFRHKEEQTTRLVMRMPAELNRADITLRPGCDAGDGYILSHVLMIAYMLATSGKGTLLIHASAVMHEGRAYLFQGKSGTGKSTHAGLWVANIAGAELMNDDNPVVRFAADGTAMAYGSPWSGKTACYRNVAAPVGAFVRIVRAHENVLQRLAPLRAYASLTASVFFMPFVSEGLREVRHRVIERLAAGVPCCEMHCRPDADAALRCCRGLHDIENGELKI